MKDRIKRLGLLLSRPVDQLSYYFNYFQHKQLDLISGISQQTQIMLKMQYRSLTVSRLPRPSLADVEFRAFSQHGEDGILLYIMSVIDSTNKRVVEICAGDGVECNAANLIINHGWSGLLFDGDRNKLAFGRSFYRRNLNTLLDPPTLVDAWIDTANVNSLIASRGVEGEIDLLSLDMDGVDYWIWQALTCVSPRVVVLEFNQVLGSERAISVPYRPDFRSSPMPEFANYWGASLPAFVKLARQKGYRLVGCERMGINAFFIRSGIAEDILPEVGVEDCLSRRMTQVGSSAIFQLDWVDV